MTTSDLPSTSAVAAEVKTRRARALGGCDATYGADDLPVLIRLPDLTAMARHKAATTPALARNGATGAATSRPASTPVVSESPPPQGETNLPVTGAETTNESAGRRSHRSGSRVPPARSAGGMGQYVLAVLLAGAIFTVIVTVKQWRQTPPQIKPPAAHERREAATPDFHGPESVPQVNLNAPELAPAAHGAPRPSGGPLETALDASQPVAPDAAGFADGAGQMTQSYDSYPSTDVAPVQTQSASAHTAEVGWPPADAGPVRSADRNASDVRYQQR